tara:strand:+ start:44 stop:1192 length:1149 start_codon:yes stop_codon:yes gene_type:complete
MRDPAKELKDLEEKGLRRNLRQLNSPQDVKVEFGNSGTCLNFSSNDYLGLANHQTIKEAYCRHIEIHGAGAGSSRLVCGTLAPHLEMEEKLADLKRAEAALTFSSGFAAATGTLPALCGKQDFIILDKLCHASLIDGARLSGATLRVFPHNDLAKLKGHLDWAENQVSDNGRIVVGTESVFSMDGDRAPLGEICDLTSPSSALLLVDEAHAFGVLGPQGRGLAAELGLESQVDLQMGTFSKAMGLSGGYLCASREIVDLLINRARSFIYSTAPSPALAATISDALDFISSEEGDSLRSALWNNISSFSSSAVSAILPVVIGENEAALAASSNLQEMGFLVPAIRYPTVPRDTARLRVTLSAKHSSDQIASLKKAIADLGHSV